MQLLWAGVTSDYPIQVLFAENTITSNGMDDTALLWHLKIDLFLPPMYDPWPKLPTDLYGCHIIEVR